MINTADPVTQWALITMVSVVMGTCLLIAVALFRRWQQIRYARYVHGLQRKYRPTVAKLLSGAQSPSGIEALKRLPLAELELVLDPVFSKRALPGRCVVFLQNLCAELGLIELWQSWVLDERSTASLSLKDGAKRRRAVSMRRPLRARGMRNLGSVRHRQSWPLLVQALDDRHPDIQLVALRALAALGALESFPLLRERLHAVIQGKSTSPPLQVLQAAMVSFDLKCLPALLPSLRHPDRNVRLHATEILLTIVRREAARMPSHAVTSSLLTPEIEDLLASELAVDTRAAVRARAAEVVVFLGDPRATPMLREFLRDQHWFVRLRAVQALDYWRPAVAPLHLDLRECLSDPHWRVREAAIRALISLGQQGKRQIYEHFLTSQDRASCEQIVEVIERSGLMSALVEEYSSGTKGVDALMVEQLASETAPLGLSGVLRTVNSETRQKFLDRFLPCAEAKLRFLGDTQFDMELPISRQQVLDFPSYMAA